MYILSLRLTVIFLDFSLPHVQKVAYIVKFIIQIFPVLAARVDLGEDISYQLALRIGPPALLRLSSPRQLQKV